MLIKNCKTNLFKENDFNVPVTMFCKNTRHYTPEAYKSAWLETIRDTLGEIVNSSLTFVFKIYTSDCSSENSICVTCKGTDIKNQIASTFEKPTSLRIDIAGSSQRRAFKRKSWLILIP